MTQLQTAKADIANLGLAARFWALVFGAMGLWELGWSFWDAGGRALAWIRFGTPFKSPDTVITFMIHRGSRWAANPTDWIQIHSFLSSVSLALASFIAGCGMLFLAGSCADDIPKRTS